jgi:uncharacterized DUF497 family protein
LSRPAGSGPAAAIIEISFPVVDPDKSLLNQTNHGCTFDIVTGFGWDAAIEVLDDRFDYGEERWLALGPIGTRLYRSSSRRGGVIEDG